MPRPFPFGTGFPQPAFSATVSSTRRARILLLRRCIRNSTGSLPAAWASSSMKALHHKRIRGILDRAPGSKRGWADRTEPVQRRSSGTHRPYDYIPGGVWSINDSQQAEEVDSIFVSRPGSKTSGWKCRRPYGTTRSDGPDCQGRPEFSGTLQRDKNHTLYPLPLTRPPSRVFRPLLRR